MLRILSHTDSSDNSPPSSKKSKATTTSSNIKQKYFSNRLTAALKLRIRSLKSFAHLYNDFKLDEEVREYRLANKEKYEETIRYLDDWLIRNKITFIRMFCNAFKSRSASFADFKAFLKDMDFPATAFETHMVCMLFDSQEKKGLSIYNFETRLRVLMKLEEEMDMKVYPQIRENARCFPNPVADSYVKMKLFSLDFFKDYHYKGHTSAVVSTKCTTSELIDILNETVALIHRSYTFFRSEKDAMIPELAIPSTTSLEEFGIKGGPKVSPPEAKLFYTINELNIACPLLRYMPYNSIRRELARLGSFGNN